MSFFLGGFVPVEGLENLGDEPSEKANKKRKFDRGIHRSLDYPAISLRRQNKNPDTTRQRSNSSSSWSVEACQVTNISNSESGPAHTSFDVNEDAGTAITKPGLPAFIEPALLEACLPNPHSRNRRQYQLPGSPKRQRTKRGHEENEDNGSSPKYLATDGQSPRSSGSLCPAPPTGIYEQLRPGSFGHLLDSLRLTDHERDFILDLLDPAPQPRFMPVPAPPTEQKASKRKAKMTPQIDIEPNRLKEMVPWSHNTAMTFSSGYDDVATSNVDREDDVHSPSLKAAAEEEEGYATPVSIDMPLVPLSASTNMSTWTTL